MSMLYLRDICDKENKKPILLEIFILERLITIHSPPTLFIYTCPHSHIQLPSLTYMAYMCGSLLSIIKSVMLANFVLHQIDIFIASESSLFPLSIYTHNNDNNNLPTHANPESPLLGFHRFRLG